MTAMRTMRGTALTWMIVLTLLVAVTVLGIIGWVKFFREEPQPDWVMATPEMRFKYGSIGAEQTAGIPYWIYYVMPRVFADKLPGAGGYASLGVPWEQGQELPVGFSKKVIGFPRVANNCAVCHTTSYRTKVNENPTYVTAGPGHTTDVEAYFRFLVECAKDARFNPDTLLAEIQLVTDLSWLDKLLYRLVIIPFTRKALLEREQQFAWIFRSDFPDWGRGRDDAMNLTRYFMLESPMDDTFGPTDMPSVWNLKKYKPEQGMFMNLAGDSHDAYSVIMDSALGVLGAAPKNNGEFLKQVEWLHEYLGNVQAPKFPFPIDTDAAERGKDLFTNQCAACHVTRTGTRIAQAEIGTDIGRLQTWNKESAIAANKVVRDMGLERKGLVEESIDGYLTPFLDGIWLRAPYLHNGSVPSLRDLLETADQRPKVFYRGYDLLDPIKVGFVTEGEEAQRIGSRHDVSLRGNSNAGHEYGVDLAPEQKQDLVEYLKTL